MTEDQAPETVTREQAVQKSYTIAQQKLRENHLTEFNELRVAAVKEMGFEWTPPPTEAEKAAAEVKALLAKHPDIAPAVFSEAQDVLNGVGQNDGGPGPATTALLDPMEREATEREAAIKAKAKEFSTSGAVSDSAEEPVSD